LWVIFWETVTHSALVVQSVRVLFYGRKLIKILDAHGYRGQPVNYKIAFCGKISRPFPE